LGACDGGVLEGGRRVLGADGGVEADGGFPGGDGGFPGGDGGGPSPDAAPTPGPPDAAAPGPCPGGCGANATCAEDGCRCRTGFFPDPDPAQRCSPPVGPADPCDGVDCGDNARCADGECACLPGFAAQGADCVAEPVGPLEARTRDEVCGRWRAEYRRVGEEWLPGDGSACDPGRVPAAAQENALRRTNLYRWLAGLPPAVIEARVLAQEQACAVTLHGLGTLNHHPPDDRPCYSAEGAAGAGSSNLAMGTGLADSVDLYVDDGGVPSLGHRRWVLGATLGATGFGFKPPFSCMYTFDMSGQTDAEFVAWPPPGFVPVEAARGRWSFAALRRRPVGDVSFAIQLDGGPEQALGGEALPGGYGGFAPTWAFDPPGNVWADGREVRVVVRGLEGGDLVYTVRFTRCG
jgi:hypothetical protein